MSPNNKHRHLKTGRCRQGGRVACFMVRAKKRHVCKLPLGDQTEHPTWAKQENVKCRSPSGVSNAPPPTTTQNAPNQTTTNNNTNAKQENQPQTDTHYTLHKGNQNNVHAKTHIKIKKGEKGEAVPKGGVWWAWQAQKARQKSRNA